MPSTDETYLERYGGFRPPISVMKGGLARAAAAGQQSASAAVMGGASTAQAESTASPAMQGLQATIQSQNDRSRVVGLLTELRRQDAIDATADKKAEQKTVDKVTWDEWATKGAALGLVISGLADVAQQMGTSTVESQGYIDKNGDKITEAAIGEAAAKANVPTEKYDEFKANYLQSNAARDDTGKPITFTTTSQHKSGFAQVAEKLQGVVSKVLPGEAARIRASKMATKDTLDEANARSLTSAVAINDAARRADNMREMTENVRSTYAGIQAIVNSGISDRTQLNAELTRSLEDLQVLLAPEDGFEADGPMPELGPDGKPVQALVGDWSPSRWELTQGEADSVKAYRSTVEKVASGTGVKSDLMLAQMLAESGGNPNARSVDKKKRVIARGLFQFTSATAHDYGISDPFDPNQSAAGAAKYMDKLLTDFGGDVTLALAAYNAGPGNVNGVVPPFKETQNYLRRIHWYYQMITGKDDIDFKSWSIKRQ